MNTHNPKTTEVKKLSEQQIDYIKLKIGNLNKELRMLQSDLDLDTRLFKDKTHTSQTVIYEYWDY
jgi:hypothetical protein